MNLKTYNFSLADLTHPEEIIKESLPFEIRAIQRALNNDLFIQKDYLLFWNDSMGSPNWLDIAVAVNGKGDWWHASQLLLKTDDLALFSYVRPCWMLNTEVNDKTPFVNWKVSIDCFLIRTETLKNLGFLQCNFKSIDIALLELGYRAIQYGIVPIYYPGLLGSLNNKKRYSQFILADQLLLIKMHSTILWHYWAAWRINVKEKIGFITILRQIHSIKNCSLKTSNSPYFKELKLFGMISALPAISVVMITLGRYKFISGVIDQLLEQTILPIEIIVIDATSEAEKPFDLGKKYANAPIPIIVEKAKVVGQCSQRNQGILKSKGNYVYFIDDDMEGIQPNHLSNHWQNIQRYKAEVSSGMPDEVGIAPMERANKWAKVSDVFPTNDSLVYKPTLFKAGLFDIKMDKGQSEDHELGIRLFKSGALMVLDPFIASLHLRASSGGLRIHGARKVTYSSARNKIAHRRLPHITEFYLSLKHHKKSEVDEMKLISAFGTFSIRGNFIKKLLKIATSFLYLPHTLIQLNKKIRAAKILLNR